MIVTKIGGSIADACPNLLDELAGRDDTVLVHGFGPQTDRELEACGIEQRTLTSPSGVRSRYTDAAVLDAMRTASRQVAEGLAQGLRARGQAVDRLGHAVPLVWATAKPALRDVTDEGRVVLVRGNRSGRVAELQAAPVVDALARGRLPLVTPLAMDERGPVSVDADRAAAGLAVEVEADALVLLTDVPRVLDAEGAPIERLPAAGIDGLLEAGAARGGMLRKLVAAREAVAQGVDRVLVADGRVASPLERALDGDATEVVA